LVEIGNWGGFGRVVMFFRDWHRAHPFTYLVAKFFMPGHQ